MDFAALTFAATAVRADNRSDYPSTHQHSSRHALKRTVLTWVRKKSRTRSRYNSSDFEPAPGPTASLLLEDQSRRTGGSTRSTYSSCRSISAIPAPRRSIKLSFPVFDTSLSSSKSYPPVVTDSEIAAAAERDASTDLEFELNFAFDFAFGECSSVADSRGDLTRHRVSKCSTRENEKLTIRRERLPSSCQSSPLPPSLSSPAADPPQA